MSPKPSNKSIPPMSKDISEKCDSKICKLSVFASVCALISLVLYGVNYYNDNKELFKHKDLEIKEYLNRVVQKEIRDEIFRLRAEFCDKKLYRERRNAMLVSKNLPIKYLPTFCSYKRCWYTCDATLFK